ncbi:MAG: AAA family ATPase [Methylovulum sp.]|nr:AAA family ATPase [Methylovulum sp.]
MPISPKSPRHPEFLRSRTRSLRAGAIEQHNPYQSLAAVYILRLALGLRNQLTAKQLRSLFEDELGIITGLADAYVPHFKTVDEVSDFFENHDEDDFLPKNINKDELIRYMRNQLKQLLDQDMAVNAPLFSNLKLLSEQLSLNATEQEILVLRLLVDVFSGFKFFLCEYCDKCTSSSTLQYLNLMTTRPINELQKALRPSGRLWQLDWIRLESRVCDLEDKLTLTQSLLDILLTEHESVQALFGNFFQEAKPSSLALNDYAYLKLDLNIIMTYLKVAQQTKKVGVNILIYGPPGTGKTELSKLIAAAIDTPLIEINHSDEDGDAIEGKHRFSAYKLAQLFLAKKKRSDLILFDEAEDVFPSNQLFSIMGVRNTSLRGDKAWINYQLENNPVPMIWIVNKTSGIDPAYLRRFDYSLEIDKMPLAVRRRLVQKYTKNLEVEPSWREQLANHGEITPAQIAKAAAMVNACQGTKLGDQKMMEQILNASSRLLKQKSLTNKSPIWTGYDLAYVNTHSEVPLADLIAGLQRNPKASLCFYGWPGTGKTALGRHISEQLGLPLMVKKASDLLGMYVGQSEKNIARMFRDAKNQGCILLLDEADSLLSDRRDAHHRWEVSQVNEMLTQMEQFNGIFICTTNLFEKLDAASLRRFDFKIRFDYLTPEQRWSLFEQEVTRLGGCLPNSGSEIAKLQRQIQSLTQLTPGDFAVVNRRQSVLGVKPEPEQVIKVLTQECKAKGEKFAQIGFVQ